MFFGKLPSSLEKDSREKDARGRWVGQSSSLVSTRSRSNGPVLACRKNWLDSKGLAARREQLRHTHGATNMLGHLQNTVWCSSEKWSFTKVTGNCSLAYAAKDFCGVKRCAVVCSCALRDCVGLGLCRIGYVWYRG
jgi:hypothetical protein